MCFSADSQTVSLPSSRIVGFNCQGNLSNHNNWEVDGVFAGWTASNVVATSEQIADPRPAAQKAIALCPVWRFLHDVIRVPILGGVLGGGVYQGDSTVWGCTRGTPYSRKSTLPKHLRMPGGGSFLSFQQIGPCKDLAWEIWGPPSSVAPKAGAQYMHFSPDSSEPTWHGVLNAVFRGRLVS